MGDMATDMNRLFDVVAIRGVVIDLDNIFDMNPGLATIRRQMSGEEPRSPSKASASAASAALTTQGIPETRESGTSTEVEKK